MYNLDFTSSPNIPFTLQRVALLFVQAAFSKILMMSKTLLEDKINISNELWWLNSTEPILVRKMPSIQNVAVTGAKTTLDDTLLSFPGDDYATRRLLSHFRQIRVKPGNWCNTRALELGVLSHALTTSWKPLLGSAGHLWQSRCKDSKNKQTKKKYVVKPRLNSNVWV